jgi:hypothetical protein
MHLALLRVFAPHRTVTPENIVPALTNMRSGWWHGTRWVVDRTLPLNLEFTHHAERF